MRSKFNKKHHFEKLRVSAFQFRRNWRLRMRLSRAMAISNRTAPRSDASGVGRFRRRTGRGRTPSASRFRKFVKSSLHALFTNSRKGAIAELQRNSVEFLRKYWELIENGKNRSGFSKSANLQSCKCANSARSHSGVAST